LVATNSFGPRAPRGNGESFAPTISGTTTRIIAQDFIQIDIGPIIQTGANIATAIIIPFPHRLLRMEVKHTRSTLADSSDALTWNIQKNCNNPTNIGIKLREYITSTVIDFIELFGYEWIEDSSGYIINTNTTNTDRIYIRMVVEKL